MDVCSICFIDESPESEYFDTNCNHSFHASCLRGWIKTHLKQANEAKKPDEPEIVNAPCPQCRKPLVESQFKFGCGYCKAFITKEESKFVEHMQQCIRPKSRARILRENNVVHVRNSNSYQQVNDAHCYNCGKKANHLSKFCPEAQRMKRCDVCGKVASEPDQHGEFCSQRKWWRTNVNTERPLIVKNLALCYVRAYAGVWYHNEEEMRSNEPIVHSSSGTVVYPLRRTSFNQIGISAISGAKCTIDIVNRDWLKLFRLVMNDGKLTINNKYEFMDSGNTELIENEFSLGVDQPDMQLMIKFCEYDVAHHMSMKRQQTVLMFSIDVGADQPRLIRTYLECQNN